eukprot:c16318_g1_i1 orf=1-480(-)
MTRVVVQRGQGSSSSTHARATSASSSSGAPPPPPLPPPPLTQSSSSPLASSSGEEFKEAKECVSLVFEDSSFYSDENTEVKTFPEDGKAVEGAVANDEGGRETPNAFRYCQMAEEVKMDSSDHCRQNEAGSFNGKATTSGECAIAGPEVEQLTLQLEDAG